MNILGMVEGVTGLFPKKVTVMLIHAVSGKTIGVHKMDSEQLPEAFNKPTILKIAGSSWRITKAAIAQGNSYLRGKKLVLYVREVADFNQGNKFMVPSQAYPLPTATSAPLFNDFTLPVSADDWRQLEFLPDAHLPLIQEEIGAIESILSSSDALLGYDTLHIRENIGENRLEIPFAEFFALVNSKEKGNISFNDGFIENGFSLRSDNYAYYGILENKMIRELALQQFDCADDELMNVLSNYGLVLVDWCNANILSVNQ